MSTTAYFARTAWLGIEQQFLNNRESRAMLLDVEFRTLSQGILSIDDYCRKMKSMADALADFGEPINDRTLVLNVSAWPQRALPVHVAARHPSAAVPFVC